MIAALSRLAFIVALPVLVHGEHFSARSFAGQWDARIQRLTPYRSGGTNREAWAETWNFDSSGTCELHLNSGYGSTSAFEWTTNGNEIVIHSQTRQVAVGRFLGDKMHFTLAEPAPGTTTEALLRRKAPAETQRASSEQQYLRQLETQLAMFDVTRPESIPRLVEFLKTGTPIIWRESGEVWKYAAAQALFLMDTAQSRDSLRHYMVDPLYDFDFSIQCALDWGMGKTLLNSFIRQYHLSGASEGASIKLEASKLGGHENAYRFVIRITNTSTATCRFYRPPAHLGLHILLLSDVGDIGAREGQHIRFGEIPPDLRYPAVAPGKSIELEFTGYFEADGTIGFERKKVPFVFLCGDIGNRDFERIAQLEDQSLFRHGAGAWDTLHALERDGVYDTYAIYRKGPLPKAPFDNVWTGRLVSKPIRIKLQAQEREPARPAEPSQSSGR